MIACLKAAAPSTGTLNVPTMKADIPWNPNVSARIVSRRRAAEIRA